MFPLGNKEGWSRKLLPNGNVHCDYQGLTTIFQLLEVIAVKFLGGRTMPHKFFDDIDDDNIDDMLDVIWMYARTKLA
jgi:hypothetical protein